MFVLNVTNVRQTVISFREMNYRARQDEITMSEKTLAKELEEADMA